MNKTIKVIVFFLVGFFVILAAWYFVLNIPGYEPIVRKTPALLPVPSYSSQPSTPTPAGE